MPRVAGQGGSRVLIAGGGTGGHLMPALSVATALRELPGDFEPVLVGAQRGVEARLLQTRDFRYHLLPAEPIYRRTWWKNARWPFVMGALFQRLAQLFREEHPVAVLGTGGYASAPVVWWASRHGIPTAIQEQNAFPGLANRWLAKRVDEIYLGVPEALEFLKPGGRTRVHDTGNPITPPAPERAADARQRFGLKAGRKVVLVTGGSQGALALNRAVEAWVGSDWRTAAVDLLWVTGPASYEQFKQYHHPPSVHVIPFLDPMADGYAVADLVVSRAGMITVAELCAWGLPSILIPLPTAAADHQTRNAETMAAAGAAVLLRQADLTPERLQAEVWALLQEHGGRAAMAARALGRGRPKAAREIAERLAALAR
ncbi:MAG TPA: UDP-N-acetylglucosamine--N-acetylmuramyl-(pentapeptide) pyrophosphoryl-undecaprenol N-acetylglucosamine transferase [Gemmatimonadales bacterium]|nr:UDP-N-acetylglucosamine--N-acetylmuramyl-(pentapeptide) pyrophosphoryl-undecaprenol N-acetylglucosamine transferase [Gemmatimonadales bacterium]